MSDMEKPPIQEAEEIGMKNPSDLIELIDEFEKAAERQTVQNVFGGIVEAAQIAKVFEILKEQQKVGFREGGRGMNYYDRHMTYTPGQKEAVAEFREALKRFEAGRDFYTYGDPSRSPKSPMSLKNEQQMKKSTDNLLHAAGLILRSFGYNPSTLEKLPGIEDEDE